MRALGLGLEAFDDTGRFRTMEKGKPVDATGEVVGTVDQDGNIRFECRHDVGCHFVVSSAFLTRLRLQAGDVIKPDAKSNVTSKAIEFYDMALQS